MVEAQILSQPPISGTVDEVRFDAAGSCTWIKFTDENYGEWCGIFGHGFGTSSNDAVVNDIGQSLENQIRPLDLISSTRCFLFVFDPLN